MKRRGHVVQYLSGAGGVMGKIYNMLLDDGHVDLKLLGEVLDACLTLNDKGHFLNALLLRPPTDQQREWIEAFGLAWRWTDVLYNTEYKIEVIRPGCEEPITNYDDRKIN